MKRAALARKMPLAHSTTQYIPISRRAVIQRLGRKLAKQGKILFLRRGWEMCLVVDKQRGQIMQQRGDIERFARELGVLKPYERME